MPQSVAGYTTSPTNQVHSVTLVIQGSSRTPNSLICDNREPSLQLMGADSAFHRAKDAEALEE